MEIVVICIIGSVITSVGVTKVLATHYFKIVDGYVKEMCEKTKEFVNAFLYKQSKRLDRDLLTAKCLQKNKEERLEMKQKFSLSLNTQEFVAIYHMQNV